MTIPRSFRDVSCWQIAILRPEHLKESDFTEYLYMIQVILFEIWAIFKELLRVKMTFQPQCRILATSQKVVEAIILRRSLSFQEQ